MNKNEIVIAGLIIIITVFAVGWILNIDIGSFLSEAFSNEAEFQMTKVVICTECDIQYIYTAVNITPEELSMYPVLKSALNGEVCVKYRTRTDMSLCKVTQADWKKIKDFIESKTKAANGTYPFCINFGKMYGDTCYAFAFVKP